MSVEDYKYHAHLNVRYHHRGGSMEGSDYSLLLVGTKDDIGKSISNYVSSAIEGGRVASITLIPVPPHEVWDLEKNSPS